MIFHEKYRKAITSLFHNAFYPKKTIEFQKTALVILKGTIQCDESENAPDSAITGSTTVLEVTNEGVTSLTYQKSRAL